MSRIKVVDSPVAAAAPVVHRAPVLAMLDTLRKERSVQTAERTAFTPATMLALLPAKFPGFNRIDKGRYERVEKDGFVALFDWPAYTDDDGKSHPATLRVAKFQSSGHVTSCVDESGKVRDGKSGWMSSISREDLALYSGVWDALLAEAKKNS